MRMRNATILKTKGPAGGPPYLRCLRGDISPPPYSVELREDGAQAIAGSRQMLGRESQRLSEDYSIMGAWNLSGSAASEPPELRLRLSSNRANPTVGLSVSQWRREIRVELECLQISTESRRCTTPRSHCWPTTRAR